MGYVIENMKFLLTWSAIEGFDYERCNHAILLNALKDMLKDQFKDALEYAVIAIEKHTDRVEPHFHAAIKLSRKLRKSVNNLKFLDRVPNCQNKNMAEFIRAINYVKKDGDYIEINEWQSKKKLEYKEKIARIKSVNFNDWIENGALSLSDVKLYKETKAALTPCWKGVRSLRWYFGETGTGKTKTAWEEATNVANENTWRIASITFSGKQFVNGYDGEEIVIIDDFRRNLWPLQELLKMCDRYPYICNIKGGYSNWNARYIIITCPTDPIKAFTFEKNDEEHPYDNVNQLLRRLQEFGKIVSFPDQKEHKWDLETLEELEISN